MGRFLTRAAWSSAAWLTVYVAGAATLFAQAPAPAGQVVGVGTFIHVVADLDKTMRFYGDRLGLERNGAAGPRAFGVNAVVEGLYDAKGSQSRVAVFKIPGAPLGLEFAEFKNTTQKAVHPRIQDPGASLVVIPVHDIDAVMAKLKEDATPVVGEGGAKRTVLVKDPDGFYIQLVEGTSGAKLSLTVDSTDKTLHLFRDLLGLQPEVGKAFVKDKDRLKSLGLRSGSLRSSTAKIPGTEFEVEFVEFMGVDHQAVASGAGTGIHDLGAGVLRLMVRSVDGLLPTLKGAGVPVVTAGGETVSVLAPGTL